MKAPERVYLHPSSDKNDGTGSMSHYENDGIFTVEYVRSDIARKNKKKEIYDFVKFSCLRVIPEEDLDLSDFEEDYEEFINSRKA